MSDAIALEINWLISILETRLGKTAKDSGALPPPPSVAGNTNYALFVEQKKLLPPDRLLLILALSSVLEPELVGRKNQNTATQRR
jgi:hypothetical protein